MEGGFLTSPIHLFLTGYRGSGKSSTARELSALLGRPWVDTDDLVEASAGESISYIFRDRGEEAFRSLETAVLSDVCHYSVPHVVALGGGAILREENRRMISKSGWVAWLRASPEVLAGRISNDTSTLDRRPALSRLGTLSEIRNILESRMPIYESICDWAIDTENHHPDQIAQEIRGAFERWLASHA